ncbi:MAG: acetylglutamate kinase [Candidatus Altiarchaeales archaeon]|nr:MAG: acetylglutamate kinase [Candidatus Altiarchaeales archaeon]
MKGNISDVLINALMYIQKFKNKLFVIKLGGEVMLNENVMNTISQDIILLNSVNIKPVVIHGGGYEISNAMKKFGKKPRFVEGLRVTDEETMDIVKMVLIGKVNSEIVSRINKHGGNAVGISGKSGKLFLAKRKNDKIDLGLVGEIVRVNSEIVKLLIDKNYIPVISPVGFSNDGTSLNINADTAAAKLAISLNANKLIIMTSVGGVLDENNRVISRLSIKEAEDLIKRGIANKGMIPKLNSCIESLKNGVERAHIIKSREHALLEEIFTSKGIGTMVYKK